MNDDCLQDDDLYGLPRVMKRTGLLSQAPGLLHPSNQQLTSVLLPYPAGAETSINGRRGSFSSRSSSLARCTWSAGSGGRWSLLRRIGVCGVCVSNPLLSKLVLTLSSPYGPLYSVLDADDRLLAKSDLHQEIDRRFREANIEIAFPQRDLHLRSVDELVTLRPQETNR